MNRRQNQSARAAALQVGIGIILMTISVMLLATSFRAAVNLPPSTPPTELSLAERVAYQYAIEEVYWRHRIWPKENGRAKRPLNEVVSAEQIQQKVERALHDSQLLADNGQAITREQLQAEIGRMASHTQQPDVLRELFAALNYDPTLVAECLVRPVLSERLVRNLSPREEELPDAVGREAGGRLRRHPNERQVTMNAGYTLPKVASPSTSCSDDTWVATTTSNAPAARDANGVVWTGSEMIIWGSFNDRTGDKYNPSTDSWTATNTTNAPTDRSSHTAIWTGTEMIIWGGDDSSNNQPLNSGGMYNPAADTWVATTTTNAPGARDLHTAVWTGSEMIVWGGSFGSVLNDGGRYNPSTNSWIATTTTGAPAARFVHTAVWTGSEMIVWGGISTVYANTGGRYNPSTNSWVATTTSNAPGGRTAHTAVWTGNEMIVWGGYGNDVFGDGGKYNPSANSWVVTTTNGAPEVRAYHTAIWTGGEMIVWGGVDFDTYVINTGGRYNPFADSWVATTTNNAPAGRWFHAAIWTGNEMIVWGGDDYGAQIFQTGGRYCAQGPITPTPGPTETPSPTATPTVAPTPSPGDGGTVFYQNFDTAVPPVLPPGWNASFTAGSADCTPSGVCPLGTNWATTKSNPGSGPICAFHDAPTCVTDSVLDTPQFFVPNIPYGMRLSFRSNFNLESGRDGGVVEISINGGPFADIGAAGGSVVYNGTISTAFQSPIGGRLAWTGDSEGYIPGSATLPNSAKGQTVVLRFRLATDCGGSGAGWSIDEVWVSWSLNGQSPTPPPPPTPTPTATPSSTSTPTPTATVSETCCPQSPSPTPSPTPSPASCVSQGFDDISSLVPSGWFMQNNSMPGPGTGWFQGNTAAFPAHSGANNSYIAANYLTGTATSTISNWLLTPPLTLANGMVLSFYTRTTDTLEYPDRLQVRMSTTGSSTNVGATATSVGDFTTLLLDINPTYTTSGYPNFWTPFTVTVSGLPSTTVGRFALRYFVENGGPDGFNSDYIGIDTLQVGTMCPPTPTPSSLPCPATFSNPAPITIPASGSSGISSPYPSSISVSNLTSPITEVTVSLYGVTHAHPKDMDLLLVGPSGQNAIIMSDGGGYSPITGLNLFFNNGATNRIPNGGGPFTGGSVNPVNYTDCGESETDPFPAPAPPPSGGSSLFAFNGTNPNGTWSLYVVDDKNGNVGSVANGWAMTIRTCPLPSPTSTPTAPPSPSFFIVNTPANVNPGVPFSFTVTSMSQFGSPINYFGTIHFASSDGSAVLPADSSLSGSTGIFSAVLNQNFTIQTIAATDTIRSSLTGTSSCISIGNDPTPTPIPGVTPTPGPTVTISGSVGNCASPVPTATPPATPTPPTLPPVPGVLMTMSGSSSGTTLTNSSGNYSFTVATGGSYTITPSKGPLAAASTGINNVDVLAIQRHFLAITLIPAGCRLTAADPTVNGSINNQDVLAVQRFFLGFTSGTGSCGQYKFTPASRTYSSIGTNQSGQNYSMYVLGDVASAFANRPEDTSSPNETEVAADLPAQTRFSLSLPRQVSESASPGDKRDLIGSR